MLRSFLLCFLFVIVCSSGLFAQTDSIFPELTIGQWRQHLPWQRAVSVTNSATKVYFASEWAVVEIDKADRSSNYLTKVQGLSDIGIKLVRFDRAADALLIAYNNSNIDLYYPTDERVVNLPFIAQNTNLGGDKRIYDVTFNDGDAYVATGFGILKMNLTSAEVVFTVFTNVPVRSFAVHNGQYYAGTDEGLFTLPENDENPADFSRWTLLGATQNIPEDQVINALAVFNGDLYMGISDQGLFRFNGTTCTLVYEDGQSPVRYLTTEGPGLVVGWRKDFNGRVTYLETNGNYNGIDMACNAYQPLYAIEDGSKRFWFADLQDEYRTFDMNTGVCDKFAFNSPYREAVSEIAIRGNKVFVATPGPDIEGNPLYIREGIYIFDDDGQWKRLNGETNPELTTNAHHVDWWRIAPHPTDERIFIGGLVGGLVTMNDDGSNSAFFDQYNSVLKNAGNSGLGRTAIGGLVFDEDNNLWISNYDASKPIAVMKPDGTISTFSSPRSVLTQVAVDQNNYKWFVVGFNGGLVVYDSGAKLDDESDDRTRLITSENSVLATNSVNCVAPDLDGDVWVGTQAGLYSFECGSNIFDATNPCKGTRQIINVDGFNGYLLQDENIRTIAIDGANRKWIGTENGIFVQSPDGRTTVARFTATNSPLLSNSIYDIAINGKSGEVWIATNKGIISVRADATDGGKINTRKPYAYPNPVRPDYDGPIAIYGLARDANVKITDIAGHLVYEGTALGGQAIWNGRDYLGRRAASGVYLIYATSSESFDTPDAIITKVVIIN